MDEELKKHIREPKTWLRGVYILLFLVCYSVAKVIIFAIIIFQFILTVITGKTNKRLVKLNSDYHPYPFGAWPSGTNVEQSESKDIKSE